MKTLQILSFLLMFFGLLVLFGIHPTQILAEWQEMFVPRPLSLRKRIEAVQKASSKKRSFAWVHEARAMLSNTGKENQFIAICLASAIGAVIGIVFAILAGNLFLVPVLGYGVSLIPFWYVFITTGRYRRHVTEELEVALSIVTTSYLRSENLLLAVEENLPYMNVPVQDIFRWFSTQTRLVTGNVAFALGQLKQQLQHEVFREWCDAMAACYENRNLKSTLMPIVNKLSDIRMISGELESILYGPMKEFITMAVMLGGCLPVMYVMNKDWYRALVETISGQITVALALATLVLSIGSVIQLALGDLRPNDDTLQKAQQQRSCFQSLIQSVQNE